MRNIYTKLRYYMFMVLLLTHTKEMRLSLRNDVKMRQRMLFTIIVFALTILCAIYYSQPPYNIIIIFNSSNTTVSLTETENFSSVRKHFSTQLRPAECLFL